MIRFIVWARLKDRTGWKASEVLFGGRHASDYARWKAMKLVYEKNWSLKELENYEKNNCKRVEAE